METVFYPVDRLVLIFSTSHKWLETTETAVPFFVRRDCQPAHIVTLEVVLLLKEELPVSPPNPVAPTRKPMGVSARFPPMGDEHATHHFLFNFHEQDVSGSFQCAANISSLISYIF